MEVKVAAILRTNIPSQSVHNEFLNIFSEKLAQEFCTHIRNVTVEVKTDCKMLRDRSSATMAVIQLYHNANCCNDETKHQYAQRLAEFLAHDNIKIPKDRVLVLFHDTRMCSSMSSSQHGM